MIHKIISSIFQLLIKAITVQHTDKQLLTRAITFVDMDSYVIKVQIVQHLMMEYVPLVPIVIVVQVKTVQSAQ